jgi:hypothetical protein
VWLKKTGRRLGFILGPVFFMNVMTVWALVLLLRQYRFSAVGIIAAVLLSLALILIVEAFKTFKKIIFA